MSNMPHDPFARWRQILTEADIAPVRLGMTRDELRELFGRPDDTGGTSRRQREPLILVYGSVEFHFAPDGGLTLIYEESDEGVIQLSIAR